MTSASFTRSTTTGQTLIPWICASCKASRHKSVSKVRALRQPRGDGIRTKRCTLGNRAYTTTANLKESSRTVLSHRSVGSPGWSQRVDVQPERFRADGISDSIDQTSDSAKSPHHRRELGTANSALDPATLLSKLRAAGFDEGNGVRSRTTHAYGSKTRRNLPASQKLAYSNTEKDRSDQKPKSKNAAYDSQGVKWNTTGMADHDIAFITSLLCRFHPSINLTQVKSIFIELQHFHANPQNPRAPPLIYERLITTYLNLRNPAGAIEVYNAFIKAGHEPAPRTYAILMRGAAKGRDMKALQAFWGHMRKSGLKADAHIWSVLIFGLIRAGKIEEGVQALESMGVEWIQAARAEHSTARIKSRTTSKLTQSGSNVSAAELVTKFVDPVLKDGTAKPTTVVMNTAIAALASRKPSLVPRILAWGKQFALQPDRTTYNYMLNMSMRQGKSNDALAILKLMESQSIGTDSGTWTIVLRAWFDSGVLWPLSDTELEVKVFDFIDSIRSELNSSVDEQGYAIVINAFLKYHGSALLAQRAIEHMIKSGLRPTAHIYTMLITYFFQNPSIARTKTSEKLAITHQHGDEHSNFDLEIPEDQSLDDEEDWQPSLNLAIDTESITTIHGSAPASQSIDRGEAVEYTPDYASLAALWKHVVTSGTKGVGLDAVYFDRLIEGYAIHHRTSPDRLMPPPTSDNQRRDLDAIQLGFPMIWPALRLMGSLGLQPSWRALEALVRALAERGEWHDFRKIVERARRRVKRSQSLEGVSRRFQQTTDDTRDAGSSVTPASAFGQRSFWEFVISTGYLEQEGIMRAEDMMLALGAHDDSTHSRLADIAKAANGNAS
nr:pentatricopeptide repeat-containing protein, chloroplastic [Quercus suber]